MKTSELELFPKHTVSVGLYDNVSNSEELLSLLLSQKISVALLNPALVIDPLVIGVAANKAVHALLENKFATRNIHSELIYYVSPHKNISESLKKFGIQASFTTLILAVIDATPQQLQEVQQLIKGEEIPLENLSKFSKIDQISKEYQIKPHEGLNVQKEVLNAIAIKGL